jgi:hypothetical protein
MAPSRLAWTVDDTPAKRRARLIMEAGNLAERLIAVASGEWRIGDPDRRRFWRRQRRLHDLHLRAVRRYYRRCGWEEGS